MRHPAGSLLFSREFYLSSGAVRPACTLRPTGVGHDRAPFYHALHGAAGAGHCPAAGRPRLAKPKAINARADCLARAPIRRRSPGQCARATCDLPTPPADALTKAENAVANAPRQADLRAALGMAYLREGRFQSATAALGDAVTLGDTQPRTQLSLALAQPATGRPARRWPRWMPTAPRFRRRSGPGAGAGGRSGARRCHSGRCAARRRSSPKLRANLAYAYALDGRWTEARNLAALDMPADKVDERMTEWAATAQPDAAPRRVAAMLNVAIKADGGMPTALALKDGPSGAQAAQLASAAQVAAPLPAGPVLGAAPVAELPPVAANTAPAAAPVAPPAAEPAALPAPDPLPPPLPPTARPRPSPRTRKAPPRCPHPRPRAALPCCCRTGRRAGEAGAAHAQGASCAHQGRRCCQRSRKARRSRARRTGGRAWQRFACGAAWRLPQRKNARAARAKALHRDKSLSSADVTIAKAVVEGKTFWRVSLGGLDAAAATGKCEAIRKNGGTCFARNDSGASAKLAEKPMMKKSRKTLALADKLRADRGGISGL
jgi:hypothetical protein